MSTAAELLVRRALGGLRGVTLLSKSDVASDVATLELTRLSSAKGKTRVTLGKFARASGLIVVEVDPAVQNSVGLRVIDLRHPDREKVLAGQLLDADETHAAAALMVRPIGETLGRPPTGKELARISRQPKSPKGRLTRDVLKSLANGIDARTDADRELFLQHATLLAPDAPLVWYLYARQLHASGQALEAVSAYRRAIRLDDARPAYHYDLGNAFFDERRYAEAGAEYERTIALDGAHAPSHENLIRALKAQGLKGNALLVKYDEVATAHAGQPVVHLQRGRLLVGMKRLPEAALAFRKAVELDADDPIGHFNLGHALERAGNADGAITEYKRAVTLAPNYAKAHNNLALLYEQKKREMLALFHYQQAVKYAPDYALAWNNLGILYGRRGKHRLEVEAFRHQVRLTPKDPLAHFNLGVAYHRTRQYRAAIECYKTSLLLKADDKATHWQLAQAYEREGVWNLANDHWRKVLTLDPTPDEKKTAERRIKENAGR